MKKTYACAVLATLLSSVCQVSAMERHLLRDLDFDRISLHGIVDPRDQGFFFLDFDFLIYSWRVLPYTSLLDCATYLLHSNQMSVQSMFEQNLLNANFIAVCVYDKVLKRLGDAAPLEIRTVYVSYLDQIRPIIDRNSIPYDIRDMYQILPELSAAEDAVLRNFLRDINGAIRQNSLVLEAVQP